MISVIICSRNSQLLTQLGDNIARTIGVEYELIGIDNSTGRRGICAVYNEGGRLARYPFLCFVHEDVLFHTQAWGKKLIHHLSKPSTGIVAIAGGDAQSRVPSTWSNVMVSKEIHIIQHRYHQQEKILLTRGDGLSPVKVIGTDGVFMGVRKEVFDTYSFDEDLLAGFHGYDIDFALQVSQRYNNYVVFDILLEHFSMGQMNRDWLESTLLVANKWKNQLPITAIPATPLQLEHYHWQSIHMLMRHMFQLRYPPFNIYWQAFGYARHHFSLRRFFSMHRLFLELLGDKNQSPAGHQKAIAVSH